VGPQCGETGMKRRLVLLFVALFPAGALRAEAPVYFADSRLKEAVEAQLWISDPTPEDLLGLTRLYAGGDGIIDLTGLEYARNLQSLELPSNEIVDISALSALTNLQVLNLRSNRIKDISALSGLDSLQELDLFDNEVSDISSLGSASDLEVLNLQRNEVSDLSPLSGLLQLRSLDLHRNEVSDISALVDLPSLEWLDLRINPLSEETYSRYIPQILQNHPGIWLAYYPSTQRRLVLSSSAGGAVTNPGEGVFTWEQGEVVWLEAAAQPGFLFANWSGSCFELRPAFYLTMDDNFEMRANFVCVRDAIYVDNKVLPGEDAAVSTASVVREDGTPEHPFDQIQEAIEVAAEGASIIVGPGVYRETIDFLGKGIRLIGMEVNEPNGTTWPVIDGGGADAVVKFTSGEDANSMLIGFTITGGRALSTGAIQIAESSPIIANCLIVGNRATDSNGAAVFCRDSQTALFNCVIADNHAGDDGAGLCTQDSRIVVVNSIIWANAPKGIVAGGGDPCVRFSDVAGGWAGRGNMDTDPLFAKAGCWVDRNHPEVVLSPANPDAVWIMGDYHLKSKAGRWDPAAGAWLRDETSSPCIDAGDPRSWVGREPFPNGGIINMGVYGGTAQACKSYVPAAPQNWPGRR
jgi:hypothetical protein